MGNNSSRGQSNITGFIILGVIVLLIVGVIFAGKFFKSEEKLQIALRNGQNVTFLVCGYDKDKNIRGGVVVVFNSRTNQIATVSILPKTFLSYSKMENFTFEEAFQKKVSPDNLCSAVSKLMNCKIDYYFNIEKNNFVKLIDIIGGVEVFTEEEIKDAQKNVFIPNGVNLLDGDKAVEFLTYISENSVDAQYEQFKRLNDFIRNFMKLKSNFAENFTDHVVSTILYKTVSTNMSLSDFMIFFTEIKTRFVAQNIDYSRGMNNIILYCDKKNMPGYDYILQPKDGGRWIKKEFADALENINNQSVQTEANSIVVEILNGTDIAGFAVRTKRYLSTYGFDIFEIGNAKSDDLQNTVIIWRTHEQKAQKLADLIKCKKIQQGDRYPDKKNIDVTLILGRDFNGQSVR